LRGVEPQKLLAQGVKGKTQKLKGQRRRGVETGQANPPPKKKILHIEIVRGEEEGARRVRLPPLEVRSQSTE